MVRYRICNIQMGIATIVKLILYSQLPSCNAFVSTSEIVLIKAEMVLRDRKRGEKERRGEKIKINQPIFRCLKPR